MNIILSTFPENNLGAFAPAFQNWNSTPNQPTNKEVFLGDFSGVTPVLLNFKIKDVFTNEFNGEAFRLKTEIISSNPVVWLSASTEDFPFDGSFIPIVENAMVGTSTIAYQNLNLLSAGNYQAKLKFTIQAQISGFWYDFSTYEHIVNLKMISATVTSISPAHINFQHIQNAALPTATFTVNGLNWKITSGPKLLLSTSTPGITITPFTNERFQAEGSGLAIFTLGLSSYFNLGEAVGSEFLENYVTLVNTDTNMFSEGTVRVTILDPFTFTVDPETLSFLSVGSQQADAQDFYVNCSEEITVTNSEWLDVSFVSAVPSQTKFSVRPISGSNLTVGVYTGFITASATINGSALTRTAVVIYEIIDFVSWPYNASDFAFTLEDEFVGFTTEYIETHFELLLTVRTYSFETAAEKVSVLPYKVPLFENKSEMNIGRIVHRLMQRMSAFNENTDQYKVALVDIKVTEKQQNGDIVREVDVSNIKFVAGVKPKTVTLNKAVLQLHEHPTRITPQGFAYVNMLLPFGFYVGTIRVNGENRGAFQFTVVNTNITTRKIFFSDYNVNQGDVVEYVVYLDSPSAARELAPIKKSFICFPSGKESNFIVWEESNNLKNVLEFTGDYKLLNEYDHTTHQYRLRLVDVLKKIDSTKKAKFQINTGWILKTDQLNIDSLTTSKRAWLLNNNEAIELVCVGKTMTAIDNTRGLIEFDVEFHINRKSDAQDYNF